MVVLVWVALGLLAAALATDLIVGVASGWRRTLPYLLGAAASLLWVIVGAVALTGRTVRSSLDAFLGFGSADLAVDRLSGLFLVIAFTVAVPASLACAAWAARSEQVHGRGLGTAYALTLGALAVIFTADHIFVFLFAWESLTVAFYLLTAVDKTRVGTGTAAVITATMGRSSGAALLIGFLLLAARSGSFTFASFQQLPQTGWRDAAFALLVAGFAVKIGLIPVHIWMPRGYRAASGPLRAIMAGVAVNAGFYGLWRTLDLLHRPPPWLAVVILLLAGATALLGIAHATVQIDLVEVVAYSSVENSGLITVGYAVALIGALTGLGPLTAVGLLAATLQMIAHALAKTLLFVTTAGIETATGTTELDDLRGVGHRLPWYGTGLAIGSLTLAGLPLTVGFVSEWFLLESLMQQFRLSPLQYTLPLAIAGALVALTTGFAAVAFVRIVGLTVLGPRSRADTEITRDRSPLARLAVLTLAAGCLVVAVLSPLEIRVIAAGLTPLVGAGTVDAALAQPWVLGPVYPDFSVLSPSWLAIMLPLLLAGVAAGCFALAGTRMLAIRRVPAWRSASGGVEGENQYKPSAFTNPTRKVLANVLLTRAELRTIERSTGGMDDDPRRDAGAAHLGYTSDVLEAVETFLYRPLLRPLTALVRTAKRLQNGRLDAYVAYMLIALIAGLAVMLILV
ncbi:proton-conducting transporter membrane subunit [Nocardia sp. NPDC051570]|uniref:proton-conducting transporter transmembrane domain-containing protein n=1 Tax=Nocardia sp. NPDC051570 TaxID=3364324 RepID=UPI0037B508C2